MKTPFAVIDGLRNDKAKIVELLITTLIKNQLILVIVKTRPTIMDRLRKNQIQIAKCKSFNLYAVTDLKSIKNGIDFLLKMKWHKPTFHMLIGKKGFEEKISNSAENKDVYSIEKELESDILCYIDPVDDQLEFYAEGFMKKIIIDAFSSVMSQTP